MDGECLRKAVIFVGKNLGKKKSNEVFNWLEEGESTWLDSGVGCCRAGMEGVRSRVPKNGYFGDRDGATLNVWGWD